MLRDENLVAENTTNRQRLNGENELKARKSVVDRLRDLLKL